MEQQAHEPTGQFSADFAAYCAHHKCDAAGVALRTLPSPLAQAAASVPPLAPGDAVVWLDSAPEGSPCVVRVQGWHVTPACMRALVSACLAATSLTTLAFFNAGLGSEALDILAEAIPKLPITSLSVDGNTGITVPAGKWAALVRSM